MASRRGQPGDATSLRTDPCRPCSGGRRQGTSDARHARPRLNVRVDDDVAVGLAHADRCWPGPPRVGANFLDLAELVEVHDDPPLATLAKVAQQRGTRRDGATVRNTLGEAWRWPPALIVLPSVCQRATASAVVQLQPRAALSSRAARTSFNLPGGSQLSAPLVGPASANSLAKSRAQQRQSDEDSTSTKARARSALRVFGAVLTVADQRERTSERSVAVRQVKPLIARHEREHTLASAARRRSERPRADRRCSA